MLRQSSRIHGADAVAQILKEGAFKKSRFFALRTAPNQLDHNRYAIILSTKLEKSAVKRNRTRRQIYAAIEKLEKEAAVPNSPSSDIVLLVRSATLKLTSKELSEAIRETLTGQINNG